MSSALVQFRTDDESKIKAMSICEKLGMDLQTYLRKKHFNTVFKSICLNDRCFSYYKKGGHLWNTND